MALLCGSVDFQMVCFTLMNEHVPGNLGIQAICGFSDCLGDLKIAWSICDCCVDFDYLQSRRVGNYFRCSAFLLSTLYDYVLIFCFGCFLLVGWSSRNIGRQLQSSVTTKRKEEVHLLKSDRSRGQG